MTESRRRGPTAWRLVAGAILALQGVATIVYSGFIPPPLTDAGVDVPLLGHLPVVWLVVGGVAIAAAVGVLSGLAWGRLLGVASEVLVVASGLAIATSLPGAALALVLPGIVLFALWRRWPGPASV
jgi:hypothetical protein